MALCEPAATELKSKNAHGVSDATESFTRIRFLILSAYYMIRLIWEIRGQLNIRECFFSNTNRTNLTNCLGCDPVCIRGRGRLVFNLIYANVFFRTRIARITRILQVRGTCFIKGKILDSLNHGEADNSSFFILHCYDILSV